MKSTNAENAMDTSHAADAGMVIGETVINKNPYGKFKDAESLLKAYESLESEFTRRSQRLKTLEGELLARSDKDKTELKVEEKQSDKEIKNGENKADEASAYIKVLERKLGELENNLSEQKSTDKKDFGEEFSKLVIQDYLKKIVQAKPKAKLFGGVALVAPPQKPQTIAEASVIAKNYIKIKGE